MTKRHSACITLNRFNQAHFLLLLLLRLWCGRTGKLCQNSIADMVHHNQPAATNCAHMHACKQGLHLQLQAWNGKQPHTPPSSGFLSGMTIKAP